MQEHKSHKKTGLWLLICGLCLIVLGVGLHFGLRNDDTTHTNATDPADTDSISAPAYDRRKSVGNSPDIMKALADSMAAARARISAQVAADTIPAKQ